MGKIIAFDVETPNRKNDRICSIGVAFIEGGKVVNTLHYLVNPECHFDELNIRIHGIRPEDIREAPAFPAVWAEIREHFQDAIVAAHNARFDLSVLQKTLNHYEIEETFLRYVDTLEIARSSLKEMENYKLPTLCHYYRIPLNHHDAASDGAACGELLCRFFDDAESMEGYIREFRFQQIVKEPKNYRPRNLSDTSRSLVILGEILAAITADDQIDDHEIGILHNWMENNQHLKGNYPYDVIYTILMAALEDGVLHQHELDTFLDIFKVTIDPVRNLASEYGAMNLMGRSVCLTGDFDFGRKEEVGNLLIGIGASIQQSVTKKTDILLVGGRGSSVWYAGGYGTKVKKALEMQGKGHEIVIIRESDLMPLICK